MSGIVSLLNGQAKPYHTKLPKQQNLHSLIDRTKKHLLEYDLCPNKCFFVLLQRGVTDLPVLRFLSCFWSKRAEYEQNLVKLPVHRSETLFHRSETLVKTI